MVYRLEIRCYWPSVGKMKYFKKPEFSLCGNGRMGVFIPCTDTGLYFGENIDMMSIGMLDAEGKMIFQDDVCENLKNGFVGVVKYDNHSASFVMVNETSKITKHFFWGGGSEEIPRLTNIIKKGNIHENPELAT